MNDEIRKAIDAGFKEKDLGLIAWDSDALFINTPIDYRDEKPMIGAYFPMHKTIQVRNRTTKVVENKEVIQFCPVLIVNDAGQRTYFEIKDQTVSNYRVRSVHADAQRWELTDIRKWLLGQADEWDFLTIYKTIYSKLDDLFEFSDDREKDLVVCWIIGTYFHRQFNTYPYLFLNGTKQVGKTKLLQFLHQLCFNAVFTLNQTPANLFRMTQELFPTFLLDETEKFGKKEESDYRTLLLCRYKRGATIYRQEDHKKDGVVSKISKRFEVYGPTALANISGLDDVLEDRVIPITLIRSKNRHILNSKIDEFSSEWSQIRSQLYFLYLKLGKLDESKYNRQEIVIDQMTDESSFNNTPDEMMIMTKESIYDESIRQTAKIRGVLENIVSSVISSQLNIFNESVSGRSKELWHPLMTVAGYAGEPTLTNLLKLAVDKTNEKIFNTADLTEEGIVLAGTWEFLKTHSAMSYHLKDITSEVNISLEKVEGDQVQHLKPREVMTILKRMGFRRAGKDSLGVLVEVSKEQVLERAERLGIKLVEESHVV